MTLNPTEKTSSLDPLLRLLVAATPLPSFDLSKRPPSASGAAAAAPAPQPDSVVLSNPDTAPEEALKNLAALAAGSQALPQLAAITAEQIAAELRGLLTNAASPEDSGGCARSAKSRAGRFA
jgi:hypothetical protein